MPNDIPIVSSGLSMGGLAAMVWAKDIKPAPVACVLNCPVFDLAEMLARRQHAIYRTLYSAFYSAHEDGTLEDAFKKVSPLHMIDEMPKIDYYIFQCEDDDNVCKSTHSDPFVTEMRRRGHRVTYHTIPGRGHCDLPDDFQKLFNQYIINAISQGGKIICQ